MFKLARITTFFLLLTVGAAHADPIAVDFRGVDWDDADGAAFHSSGAVTAIANGGNNTLYQDSTDGLGVRGGEHDEIDGAEWLEILIDDAYYATNGLLTGVFLTDLFQAPDGANEGETGWVRVFVEGGAALFFDFHQTAASANGEFTRMFDGAALRVTRLVFGGDNLPGHEYSVGGLIAAPFNGNEKVSVPEPGTLALLGSGLLLLGLRRRPRRRA